MEDMKVVCIDDKIVVSSREVARVLDKQHGHVMRDLDNMLLDNPDLENVIISSNFEVENNKRTYREYLLTKDGMTLYLFNIQGCNEFKRNYIARFNEMEKALIQLKFRLHNKEHQKECMGILQKALSDNEKKNKVNYVKANTIVNKALSNKFGFAKMVKKDEMTEEMLVERERIMEEYIKLYEIIHDTTKVKEILYDKHQAKLLESVK